MLREVRQDRVAVLREVRQQLLFGRRDRQSVTFGDHGAVRALHRLDVNRLHAVHHEVSDLLQRRGALGDERFTGLLLLLEASFVRGRPVRCSLRSAAQRARGLAVVAALVLLRSSGVLGRGGGFHLQFLQGLFWLREVISLPGRPIRYGLSSTRVAIPRR
ncbi:MULTISPECIES: leu operon leader peptide [Burkholderia]|uniref:leu operon leader peptide n=1 Tax=Burkholderia TaxID=32008 RepID=UPI00336BAF14